MININIDKNICYSVLCMYKYVQIKINLFNLSWKLELEPGNDSTPELCVF